MTGMMRSIELDYLKPAAPATWTGRVLFAAAIALSVHLGVSYQDLRDAVVHKEQRLSQLERQASRLKVAHASARNVTVEEMAFARETIERLATPWESLFGALESVRGGNVALTAVEPDVRAGTVRIAAESRDYLAALEYVSALRHGGKLGDVALVKHEIVEHEDERVVVFSITASWSGLR
jgi:hypothetical protein